MHPNTLHPKRAMEGRWKKASATEREEWVLPREWKDALQDVPPRNGTSIKPCFMMMEAYAVNDRLSD